MNELCLGIDWGEKRIGLALGNSEVKIASPFGVVKNMAELKAFIEKEKVERLVIGEPVNEKMNDNFLKFIKDLKASVNLPLDLVDERFSSQAADSLDPNARKEGNRDAMAAMIILQSYFDKLN
ncbi:MAG: Holliday junction resolvase RuvX [Candidatus Falkowbacteria bacterium]|nr:Holliday junction resolvase RuvX [Candidatus Falkowbacteria bacterium]